MECDSLEPCLFKVVSTTLLSSVVSHHKSLKFSARNWLFYSRAWNHLSLTKFYPVIAPATSSEISLTRKSGDGKRIRDSEIATV